MENKPICEIDTYGHKYWFLNGKLHREDGPAAEYNTGNKEWYINDILHREDGPAIDCKDGTKFWFVHWVQHRLDGPAVKHSDGSSYWYIHGNDVTDEITKWAKDNDIDLDNLSEDDKLLIKLVWSDYGK